MKTGLLKSRTFALGWLLLVLLVTLLAIRQGPAFDSSILNLLPESGQDPIEHRAGEQMSREFSQRLLLVVSGSDAKALRKAVASMAAALATVPGIKRVDWRVDDAGIDAQREQNFPYRFAVIEDSLRERLLKGEHDYLRERALARLYGPMSGTVALIEDPFGLYFEQQLKATAGLKLRVSHSLLEVADSRLPGYLLVLTLDGDPFSPALQAQVLGAIDAQRRRLSADIDELVISGLLLHAAAGAQQAQREISTIGIGSLLGIVVLMLLVFRRLRPLLLLLFPVTVGCLFASAASMLIFHKVHLVTFAFGAGLVGVSVDYALHFLCERQVTVSRGVLPRIMPGLLLGLFSSVAAYAALAMTPFPGLRQMAVFSVLGLSASWLTVVLWFPLVCGDHKLQPLVMAQRLQQLRRAFPKLEANRWLAGLLILIALLAGLSIWNGRTNDDIRLLQTSPESLLQQERDLHRSLGSSSGSRFLLVRADTLEACLQLEEKLRPGLQKLQRETVIDGFRMLSSSLPSAARQAENVERVDHLYRGQLEALFGGLQLPQHHLQDARAAFSENAANRLSVETWQQQSGSVAFANLLVMQEDGQAVTAIRFNGELSSAAVARLEVLADGFAGVSYVDRVQSLSSLLGDYRVQVSGCVLLAYLVVLAALLLRYRRQLWRVVLPPLLASLLTLAILLQLQPGINLFHLMALILVLGIGLDMGIFLAETGEAPHTWLAVSLSACTSLLAFGLLALSNTPVLHHFGLSVAIGLSLVWLLAPVMRRQ